MLPSSVRQLVQLFARLPGVGEKTALRFALHLATGDPSTPRLLGEVLQALPQTIQPCSRCGNLAEVELSRELSPEPAAAAGVKQAPPLCDICRDPTRDGSLLCVVATIQHLLAIERSGALRGCYFVLGKLLSPLEGISADDLPLEALKLRLQDPEQPVTEVLVATPPSVDGEATALLLAQECKALNLRISRIASGVPHGGDLEFADAVTLGRAISGRRDLD